MFDLDPRDVYALQQLMARYWARADGDLSESIGTMFTPDGILQLGTLRIAGRPAIENFFADRDAAQAAASRVTRHLATNFRIVEAEAARAVVHSTVAVHVGSGALPLPSAVPAGIADFVDHCERIPGIGWQFAARSARSVFVGPGAASFAK